MNIVNSSSTFGQIIPEPNVDNVYQSKENHIYMLQKYPKTDKKEDKKAFNTVV